MDDRFEIIDAFVDGERVNPAALKQALSEPDGRDYLVDAWVLRESVQDDIGLDVALPPPPRAWSPPPRRVWVIAAAAAGICLVAGYFTGFRVAGMMAPAPSAPSAPTAVVQAPSESTSFPVPQPTRVIRLELNANWKEGSGGG